MAGYVLHINEEENIVLGAPTVRRLIDAGDGDAALLYLCLLRAHGSLAPEALRAQLRWDERRERAAEEALSRMGLIGTPVPAAATDAPPPREDVPPEYSRADVSSVLESDASFAALLREVERKLGRLTEPSVRRLLGLYDYLGLPADVIFLLVNHCIERREAQLGPGRRPTMREIEKEGYLWARRELFTAAKADEYLKAEQNKRRSYPEYMDALRMGGRAPSPGEEKYLGAWAEMGFPADTVAVAYDKTVLKCHDFRWPYCNGILRKWHEKGLHTPEEVARENAPAASRAPADKNAWMDEFV